MVCVMRGSQGSGSHDVAAYLAKLRPEYRAALEKLRATIKEAAPGAEEVISYQMPAFRYRGVLVFYAAFSDHCSFFVGSQITQRKFAAELKSFAVGRGTLRFTPEHPLPLDLVRRIVRARVAENDARAVAKRRTAAPRRTPSSLTRRPRDKA